MCATRYGMNTIAAMYTVYSVKHNPLIASLLHSGRWRRPLWDSSPRNSRINARLRVIERTTSISAQRPMMGHTMPYLVTNQLIN
jgi:hypothetical protein